jgi:hypothetical protein
MITGSRFQLKGSFLAVVILGILFILFGIVFALQGSGMIGGSAMSGNSFWIYAGSGVAVFGVIIAFLGFYFGSRSSRVSKTVALAEVEKKGSPNVGQGSAASESGPKN